LSLSTLPPIRPVLVGAQFGSCFRVACSPRFLADYSILRRSSRQIEAIGERGVEGRQRIRKVRAGYRFPAAKSSRVSRVKCNTSDGENGHCLTARLPPTARRP